MAREITYSNFEISLVVFTPNITTNHAITYTNPFVTLFNFFSGQVCWSDLDYWTIIGIYQSERKNRLFILLNISPYK